MAKFTLKEIEAGEKFVYVSFPDWQDYSELEGFDDVAVPTDNGDYFIEENWLKEWADDWLSSGGLTNKQK